MAKINLNIPLMLSEGLGSWLMYEHHSYRADLFSEKYLAHGIGSILNGNPEKKTIAEYDHPVLKPKKTWAGRNPQLDFVQLNENKLPEIAIESKFLGIGISRINVGDVIWDLIRLELVSYTYGIKCYFILAGKSKKIQSFFKEEKFLNPRKKGITRPILPNKDNTKSKLQIRSCSDERLKTFRKYLIQYKEVHMPSEIHIKIPHFYPKACRNFDNQVFVWEICCIKKSPRFYPKDEVRLR